MSEFVIKKANKKAKKLRIGMSASSGSGKTYSSLLVARGLVNSWEEICVIDTERDSASLYADLGNFSVLPLGKPYDPQRYIRAIKAAEKDHSVIIVDSITHEWSGSGGCLDMHSKLGGRFQDWGVVTPLHNSFIDAILTSKSHVICTVRRKEDYAMVPGKRGMEVQKLGLGEETRSGFTYEMDLVFEIDNENHLAKATKDRTQLFTDIDPFVITLDTGNILKEWSGNGRSNLDEAMDQIRNADSRETLVAISKTYTELHGNEDFKTALKVKAEEVSLIKKEVANE